MNQTFITLSPAQSKGLDKNLFHNSQNLQKDAILIAEVNKSYSKATSLTILSLEECIKAILVKLHSEGLKVYKIEGVQKFVKDHKIRHQVAQLIETGAGLLEVSEKYKEVKNKPQKFKVGWLNTISNSMVAGMRFYDSAKRIEKLEAFNEIKNKGFYVGYNDQLLDPEAIISREDYIETKKITERISRFYRLLNIIYAPVPKDIPKDAEKEELKKQLKLFVEQALIGFTFKY